MVLREARQNQDVTMTTSVTASPETLRHKRSVKNYLIDSRFQLKYTGFIVGVAIVISAILGTFLWRTSRELIGESQILTAQSQALVSESKKVSDIAKSSIKQMGYDDATFLSDFNSEAGDYDKQMEAKEQALIAQQQSLIARQSTLLYTLVGGLALMVVLIGLLGIYFTHKVAGPIFKMRRLLRQVGEGKLVFSERLRKGDELKEFFDDFSRMVEQLRARQTREIGELDAAIAAAETAGGSADAVAKVVVVRDEMKRSLDS
jgi:nitrogen fixation/metabolism regulation signal transduction histidine kinase